MSRDILQQGPLHGKLPGQKKEILFYLEVSSTHLHIYEGHEDLSQSCKHLRSLEIDSSDSVGEERSKKREYRFYLNRADGRYVFKCNSHEQREEWIMQLERVINKRQFQQMPDFTPPSPYTFSPDNLSSSLSSPKIVDIPKIPPTPPSQTRKPRLPSDGVRRGDSFVGKVSALDQPLPPVPTDNPRASVVSTDSGIGPSAGGEIRRTVSSQRPGSSSVPSSGDGKFCRLPPSTTSTTSKSDGGKFDRLLGVQVEEEGDPEELDNYAWFWGCMSRQDCEKKLQSEGKVGNFVVRINANGNYIMSFWRADGVHHHRILQHGTIYCFERAAVKAEGESLVDLLDTYMKNCTDKSIRPYGGTLFLQYDDPWNPPEIDMLQLQERLREQKVLREERKARSSPKVRHPGTKDRYSPVRQDIGFQGDDSTESLSQTESDISAKQSKSKTLAAPPTKKRGKREDGEPSKNKPLPTPPTKRRGNRDDGEPSKNKTLPTPPAKKMENREDGEPSKSKPLPTPPAKKMGNREDGEPSRNKPLPTPPTKKRGNRDDGEPSKNKPLPTPPANKSGSMDDDKRFKVFPDPPSQQSSLNKPLPSLPPEAFNQGQGKNKPLPPTTSGSEKTDESRSSMQTQGWKLPGINSKDKDDRVESSKRKPFKPAPSPRKTPLGTKPRLPSEHKFASQDQEYVEEEQPEYMNWAEMSPSTARKGTCDPSQQTGPTKPYQNVDYTTQGQQPQEIHYMNISGMAKKTKKAVSPTPAGVTNGQSEAHYQNIHFKTALPRDKKRH